MDGLIKFEGPFSGTKDLSLNPVSYSAQTKKVRDQDTLTFQLEQYKLSNKITPLKCSEA